MFLARMSFPVRISNPIKFDGFTTDRLKEKRSCRESIDIDMYADPKGNSVYLSYREGDILYHNEGIKENIVRYRI